LPLCTWSELRKRCRGAKHAEGRPHHHLPLRRSGQNRGLRTRAHVHGRRSRASHPYATPHFRRDGVLPRTLEAQKAPKALSSAESTTYVQLRDRVLTGDTTADFTTLRMLYARLPDEGKPSPSALFDRARGASDSLAARAILDSLLCAYVGHVRAHRDVGQLYAMRGDRARKGIIRPVEGHRRVGQDRRAVLSIELAVISA